MSSSFSTYAAAASLLFTAAAWAQPGPARGAGAAPAPSSIGAKAAAGIDAVASSNCVQGAIQGHAAGRASGGSPLTAAATGCAQLARERPATPAPAQAAVPAPLPAPEEAQAAPKREKPRWLRRAAQKLAEQAAKHADTP